MEPTDFSWALRMLKAGHAVFRAGWNGKGMSIVLVPGSTGLVVAAGLPMAKILPVGATFNYAAHIDMKTADGTLVPWLASQTDVLAEDWKIIANE